MLCGKSQILGEVTDYFYRIEFQNRGSPHAHFLVWVKDAPKIESIEDYPSVERYVDKHISCSVNVSERQKKYVELQIHRHSKTCRKKGRPVCRFGYPIPPMTRTMVLDPICDGTDEQQKLYQKIKAFIDTEECQKLSIQEMFDALNISEDTYISAVRSSLQKPKLFLKRNPNECRVNGYMKNLISVWQANHDIQYVLNAYACAVYIVGYINKQNRALSHLLSEIIKDAKRKGSTVREQVKAIGKIFLSSTEVSAQECIYILLSLPITKNSIDVIYINTVVKEERMRILKSERDLEGLSESSVDIFKSNYFVKYENRPSFFDSWSMVDYICNICVTNKNKRKNIGDVIDIEGNSDIELEEVSGSIVYTDRNKIYKCRQKSLILRYYHYKEEDIENYYRVILLLFHPWMSEDLLCTAESYAESFKNLSEKQKEKITLVMDRYDKKCLTELMEGIAELELDEFNEDLVPGNTESQLIAEEEGSNICKEMEFFKPTVFHRDYNTDPQAGRQDDFVTAARIIEQMWPQGELLEKIKMLNYQQREIYNHIMKAVTAGNTPLRLFITGGAGVGKSVLLKTMYNSMMRFYNLRPNQSVDSFTVLCVAPTGKAAYLIRGNTIHGAFGLPANQELNYKPLTCDKRNTARTKYANLKVVLIDEVSMVGTTMFNFIDLRLQEIMDCTRSFGGVHVICFGDLFQLCPVMDSWIFNPMKNGLQFLAPNVWVEEFKLYELTIIMRQQNDMVFAEILNRLREGRHTEQDIDVLRTRCIGADDIFDTSNTILFTQNAFVNSQNFLMYQFCVNDKEVIYCSDRVISDVSKPKKKKVLKSKENENDKVGGLFHMLYAGVGLRYEVTVNLDINDGVVNGAGGILKKIERRKEHKQPAILWIQFDDVISGRNQREKYKQYKTNDIEDLWTPIFAITRRVGTQETEVQRTQFPLRPSSSKTVHTSQGDTMNSITVDLQGRVFKHAYYVALSRVRSLNNLTIRNFLPAKITLDSDVVEEMDRLRTDRLCTLNFISTRNLRGNVKIIFQNAQSLYKHFPFMASDRNFTDNDIMLFCETRFHYNDPLNRYQIPDFKSIRYDEQVYTGRSHHGLVGYLKENINFRMTSTCFSYRTNGLEVLLFNINCNCINLDLVLCYKSPTTANSELILGLNSIKNHLDLNIPCLVLGDFNVDVSNPRNNYLLEKMENILGMKQYVSEFTTKGQTTLDLCFSNIPIQHNIIYCPWSYHSSISVAF